MTVVLSGLGAGFSLELAVVAGIGLGTFLVMVVVQSVL